MNQGAPFLLLPATFKRIPDFGFHEECLLQGVEAPHTRCFVHVCSFAGCIPRKGTAGAWVGLCWTSAGLASVEGFTAVCVPHKCAQELPVLHTSPTNVILRLLEPVGQAGGPWKHVVSVILTCSLRRRYNYRTFGYSLLRSAYSSSYLFFSLVGCILLDS